MDLSSIHVPNGSNGILLRKYIVFTKEKTGARSNISKWLGSRCFFPTYHLIDSPDVLVFSPPSWCSEWSIRETEPRNRPQLKFFVYSCFFGIVLSRPSQLDSQCSYCPATVQNHTTPAIQQNCSITFCLGCQKLVSICQGQYVTSGLPIGTFRNNAILGQLPLRLHFLCNKMITHESPRWVWGFTWMRKTPSNTSCN